MIRLQALIVLILMPLFSVQLFAAMAADAQFPLRIQMRDYGIYQLLERNERSFSAETTAGYASVINTRFLQKTKVIPLKKKMVFGFNYVIDDTTTDDEWVPVVIQIKHPSTANYLGQNTVGFSKNSGARLKADGRYHNGAFYVFSEDYEMVAGEWQITVIYRNEMTVSQTFQVVDPDEQP